MEHNFSTLLRLMEAERRRLMEAHRYRLMAAHQLALIEADYRRPMEPGQRQLLEADHQQIWVEYRERLAAASYRRLMEANERWIREEQRRQYMESQQRWVVEVERRRFLEAEQRWLIEEEKHRFMEEERRRLALSASYRSQSEHLRAVMRFPEELLLLIFFDVASSGPVVNMSGNQDPNDVIYEREGGGFYRRDGTLLWHDQCPPTDFAMSEYAPAWVPLTLVCKSWHRAAFDSRAFCNLLWTRGLWSARWTDYAVHNSAPFPIDIFAHSYISTSTWKATQYRTDFSPTVQRLQYRSALGIALSALDRVRTIVLRNCYDRTPGSVTATPALLTLERIHSHPLPMLEVLIINTSEKGALTTTPRLAITGGIFLGQIPGRLREIQLEGFPIRQPARNLFQSSALDSLHLSECHRGVHFWRSWSDFAELLQNGPGLKQLRTLSLGYDMLPNNVEEPVAIYLPRLEHLSVECNLFELARLLERVRIPLNSSLRLVLRLDNNRCGRAVSRRVAQLLAEYYSEVWQASSQAVRPFNTLRFLSSTSSPGPQASCLYVQGYGASGPTLDISTKSAWTHNEGVTVSAVDQLVFALGLAIEFSAFMPVLFRDSIDTFIADHEGLQKDLDWIELNTAVPHAKFIHLHGKCGLYWLRAVRSNDIFSRVKACDFRNFVEWGGEEADAEVEAVSRRRNGLEVNFWHELA
ncbi:hypothetical protein FA95DRAFT_1601250 [Auriscalpium vulgare]|uniref:Uncharacterized protein n=1 Tax=Auriscalpium vulgare TaxID=40419 RepID=A0ACB8SBM2_9AGAM|nr:hypothetical protein FA95DRAFT_1601250 [Auriscalpium vulgare]